jgi:hypothetical protein
MSSTVLSEVIHERRRSDASLRKRIAEALCAEEHWLFSASIEIPGPIQQRADADAKDAGTNEDQA